MAEWYTRTAQTRLFARTWGFDSPSRHMATLTYSVITSLDGYVSDRDGNFDWAEPDEEVHAFVNDLQRPVGTYLYGRRLYDTMVYWETASSAPDASAVERDYASIWQAADKIVYSSTMSTVSSARTRIERTFDPDAVRELKDSASTDLSIGGADLAAQALRAGLVDEYQVFLNPVVVGGGHPALPDGLSLRLALVDEHRFAGGVVYLRYQVRR
jgi:dihydrofolate reductase